MPLSYVHYDAEHIEFHVFMHLMMMISGVLLISYTINIDRGGTHRICLSVISNDGSEIA